MTQTIEEKIKSITDLTQKSLNDIEKIKDFEQASILFQELVKNGLVKERGYTLTIHTVRKDSVYSNL